MRRITLIIIHCSATRCTARYPFSSCRRDHIRNNHWRDIGYHYYIERDGNGLITPNEYIKTCPCFDAGREYGEL